MREIIFRGRRVYNGEWIEGNLLVYPLGKVVICGADQRNHKIVSCEVDPATVGQYTGLRDKNGKRIFEGDILKFKAPKEIDGIMRSVWKNDVVCFQYEMFTVKSSYAWLDGDQNDERADLRYVILRDADLRGADLRCADLHGAALNGANLQGADLDYSSLPLWSGSLDAHFDDRQLRQIAYHLVRAGLHSKNASEETKAALRQLIPFANGFHRAEECGKIEEDKP